MPPILAFLTSTFGVVFLASVWYECRPLPTKPDDVRLIPSWMTPMTPISQVETFEKVEMFKGYQVLQAMKRHEKPSHALPFSRPKAKNAPPHRFFITYFCSSFSSTKTKKAFGARRWSSPSSLEAWQASDCWDRQCCIFYDGICRYASAKCLVHSIQMAGSSRDFRAQTGVWHLCVPTPGVHALTQSDQHQWIKLK